MYVPCLWELYYCVSLAMSWVVCVKCAEGVCPDDGHISARNMLNRL